MLKFDTLDKKPKLYGILAETCVVAAVIAVLLWRGADRYAAWITGLTTAYLLSVVVQLLIAFFRQLRYNPYSYNTIFYIGFALFLLAVTASQVLLLIRQIRYPEVYTASQSLYVLLGSAKTFMLLSFPFIVIFSAALCISNLSLIRHEGKSPVHFLGILLAFLLVAGIVFLYIYDFYASGSQLEVMIHDLVANVFAAAYLYFECMVIGTIIADAITARYEPEPDKDFIIILGCRLMPDGTPTPLLKGRIERARLFAEKQEALTGKKAVFVTSGGKGGDELISESASMKQYLLEQGVPKERIVEEDRSANTFENMQFSKEKIRERDPGARIAFSTTNYHVFRSGLYARRVKMRAVGMGARTKWYYWPNAAVREFAGLLTAHRLKQGLILGGMILFYAVLTVVVYL